MRNRHVLITGATGGLGPAVVRAALEREAAVTVSYRSGSGRDRLHAELGSELFERLTLVEADLRDEAAVGKLVGVMPRVDVLLQLAGGFAMKRTDESSLEEWTQQFDINLTPAFLACKHALPRMRSNGYGRIVLVSSRAALHPFAGSAAYSASKAGVIALAKAIGEETKGMDVTANCVLPAVIDTAANRAAMKKDGSPAWVGPSSLASLICFLGSAAAQDVRGATLEAYGNL